MKALKMYVIGRIMMAMSAQDLIGMVTAVVHTRQDTPDSLKKDMDALYMKHF